MILSQHSVSSVSGSFFLPLKVIAEFLQGVVLRVGVSTLSDIDNGDLGQTRGFGYRVKPSISQP